MRVKTTKGVLVCLYDFPATAEAFCLLATIQQMAQNAVFRAREAHNGKEYLVKAFQLNLEWYEVKKLNI